MRKPRVLTIAFNDLGHGGIQAMIMVIAKNLRENIEHDIVVFNSIPAFYDVEFEKYGRIFRCPHYEGNSKIRKKLDYYIRYFRIKRSIQTILRKYGPYDVVHSHSFFEAAPCLEAARRENVPIRIAHSHNTAMADRRFVLVRFINKFYRAMYRRIILKNATKLVGCSNAANDYLYGRGHGQVIHNCIDYEKFIKGDLYKKQDSRLLLIHVGNFLPQKNQLFLIDIIYYLLQIDSNVHLTMIGRDTEYKELVLQKIRKLKLEENVTILSHDSNVPQELYNADYFVFPSQFEGFGNVVIEAQTVGLHCFVSTEVQEETNCGQVTFVPLDAGAEHWAKIIWEHYKKNGKTRYHADTSEFTEQRFVSEIYNLYKKE